MELNFEWDDDKAKANLKHHKIGFDEAQTVFDDLFLTTFPDPDHSGEEQRYINIGCSSKGRILVIIHTQRGENLRLISCRKATTDERNFYEEGEI